MSLACSHRPSVSGTSGKYPRWLPSRRRPAFRKRPWKAHACDDFSSVKNITVRSGRGSGKGHTGSFSVRSLGGALDGYKQQILTLRLRSAALTMYSVPIREGLEVENKLAKAMPALDLKKGVSIHSLALYYRQAM